MLNLLAIHQLAKDCPYQFAVSTPDGDCVGIGGDLEPSTLLSAYLQGCFPWFNHDEPIAWWNPNPRCVMICQDFTPAKSLVRTAKKFSKNTPWHISLNLGFDKVIDACSQPRSYTDDTWIDERIKHAYQSLHRLGVGFSLEIWEGVPNQSDLIGGLYGLKIGACVFGESMFHRKTDASKIAFWALNKLCLHSHVPLIDCQLPNAYLMGLGATLLTRQEFLAHLHHHTNPNHAIARQSNDWHTMNFVKPISWLLD